MTLRVVSWNVHSCVGSDGRLDPQRVADVLASLEADFIGLQEVDSRRSRDAQREQLPFLAEQLGMHAIAGPNLREHDGDFGNGLLARHAPVGHELIDLAVTGVEPRGAIDARFEIEAFTLRLVVTHLGLSRAERRTQLVKLNERIETGPACDGTLVVGDFNEWRPRPFSAIGHGWDRLAAHARPRTFPSHRPLLRLDRVIAWPAPLRFEARVLRSPAARIASDHLPVVADVEWPLPSR